MLISVCLVAFHYTGLTGQRPLGLIRENGTHPNQKLACVASVSVRFRRKERGTRVKEREKSGASERAGRGWGRKEGNACRQTPGF